MPPNPTPLGTSSAVITSSIDEDIFHTPTSASAVVSPTISTSSLLTPSLPSSSSTIPAAISKKIDGPSTTPPVKRTRTNGAGPVRRINAGYAAVPGTDDENGEEDGDDLETGPLVSPGANAGVAVNDHVHQVTGTIMSSSINLTNTILGAGVLAMPGALASVGLGLGTFLILLSAAGSIFGLTLLSLCAARVGGRHASFFAVSKMTYPSAALWFDLAIAVKCFGVSVSYLVIIRDLMPKVILALFPSLPLTSLILSPTFWVTTAIFLVSPLAYARRLDSLKHTSALALMALVYLVLVVVGYFLWPEIVWVKVDEKFFSVVPIFVFAFTCHQNIFAVHNELVDNTINRVTSVVHYSIGTSTIVYQLVGILGYLTFARSWTLDPTLNRSNIIRLYPAGPVITLGQCALALLFLLSYPLQCHPARACLDKVMQWNTNPTHTGPPEPMPQSRHVAITTMLLIGSFIIAVSVENLDTVLSLVGATGSTTICYILPGILYYKMRDDLDRYGLGIRPTTEEDEEDLQASFTGGSSGGPLRRRSVSVLKYAAAGLAVFGVVVMVVSVSSQIAALASGGNAGGGHLKRREWSSVLA